MPIELSGLGTVTPLATITVQTQISGLLMEEGFQEGQHVTKGDFLAQIDPRPYQVALEQAQAQLAKDQAALADAELDLARYKKLVAQNSIASQTLDTQTAAVGQDKAQVLLDQAQIDTQKLNLVYCHIISPVTGRVGLRQVDPGNYVTPTSLSNGIVVVTQLQPISVIFTLPEDNLPAVLKQLHAGATLQATAYDRSGTTKLDTGRLETIDNQIDTTTGTVKLRAIFDNPNELLFPNQFVNVQLLVDTLPNADLVPNAAIQRGAPGTFVYLVKPDNTVAAQPVTLGSERQPERRDHQGLDTRPARRRRRRRPAQGRRQGVPCRRRPSPLRAAPAAAAGRAASPAPRTSRAASGNSRAASEGIALSRDDYRRDDYRVVRGTP